MELSTFDAFKRLEAAGAVPVEGTDLAALQNRLLGMLDDVMAVCATEGIVWTLGGGSVLGAVRHRGFIPWDDDLDLNLPRAEWPRLRRVLAERFGDKYAIYEPGAPSSYALAFPRIRLRGTRVVTREDLLAPDVEPGAFIDVFLLENTYDGGIFRRLHGLGSLALGFLYSCRKQFFERSLLRKWRLNGAVFRVKRMIGFLLAVLPMGAWTRLWDRWNRCCGNDASRLVTFPVGRKHFFGELAPRAELAETRPGEFCGRTVNLPKETERYLTRLYGPGYMTPPPDAKRERHVVFEPLKLF